MKSRSDIGQMAILAGMPIILIAGMILPAQARCLVWALLFAAVWPTLLYRFLRSSADNKKPAVSQASDTCAVSLASVYRGTAEALAAAIAAKDSYTHHHIARVQHTCELIARKLGLDDYAIEGIKIAALVSDVGKLGVPDYILLKPGPLDNDEFVKMRNHATIGAEILGQINYPWDIAQMVRHHHERFDGSGYPNKLEGESIPLGSRIISIAEVYDALISDRCYRDGWSHHEAVEHIKRLAGIHFDPTVVEVFLEVEQQMLQYNQSMAHPQPQSEHTEVHSGGFAAADTIAQANRELVSLFEIAQTLSSTLETDEVVALLAHRTRRLTQAATCVVLLADETDPQSLVAKAAIGRHQEVIRGARARLGSGFTGRAASRNEAAVGNYDPRDLTISPEDSGAIDLQSCAVAPIVSFGEVLGTINLYDVTPGAFSQDDLRVLTFVAQQAALAIENASAFEKVRESAMRDPLTNLHNARYLRICMEKELSRAQRLGEPLSILGIDLDNFKAVNDSYGHHVGDAVLKEVADILQHQLRDYDIAVRNGGDEFVIVLPGTPKSEAIHTAKRIQNEIEQYAEGAISMGSKRIGASIGAVSFPDDAGDLETLLAKADAAMYRDKRARKQGLSAA